MGNRIYLPSARHSAGGKNRLLSLARNWLRRKFQALVVAREVKRYNKLASKARKGVPSRP